VTVVATGLANTIEQVQSPPARVVVDNPPRATRRPDYSGFERPTALRRQSSLRPEVPHSQSVYAKAVGAEADMDFLDIPAFIRKQAD
jgi:hypothetical protein